METILIQIINSAISLISDSVASPEAARMNELRSLAKKIAEHIALLNTITDEEREYLTNYWVYLDFLPETEADNQRKKFLYTLSRMQKLPLGFEVFLSHIYTERLSKLFDSVYEKTEDRRVAKRHIDKSLNSIEKIEEEYSSGNFSLDSHINSIEDEEIWLKAFCVWATGSQSFKVKNEIVKDVNVFVAVLFKIWGEKSVKILLTQIVNEIKPNQHSFMGSWGMFLIEISNDLFSAYGEDDSRQKYIIELLSYVLSHCSSELSQPTDLRKSKYQKDMLLKILSGLFNRRDRLGRDARFSLWRFIVSGPFRTDEQSYLLLSAPQKFVPEEPEIFPMKSIRKKLTPLPDPERLQKIRKEIGKNENLEKMKAVVAAWEWASFEGAILNDLFNEQFCESKYGEDPNNFIITICKIRKSLGDSSENIRSLKEIGSLLNIDIYQSVLFKLYDLLITEAHDEFGKSLRKLQNIPDVPLLFPYLGEFISLTKKENIHEAIENIEKHADYLEVSLPSLSEYLERLHSKQGGEFILIERLYQKIRNFIPLHERVISGLPYELNTSLLVSLFDEKQAIKIDNNRYKRGAKSVNALTHDFEDAGLGIGLEYNEIIDHSIDFFKTWSNKFNLERDLIPATHQELKKIFSHIEELRRKEKTFEKQGIEIPFATVPKYERPKELLGYRLQRFRIKRDIFPLFPKDCVDEEFISKLYSFDNWKKIEEFSFDIVGPARERDIKKWLDEFSIDEKVQEYEIIKDNLKKLYEIHKTNYNGNLLFGDYLRSSFTDMRWYIRKYLHRKCDWYSFINQPEKCYMDSWIFLDMIRKFIRASLEHAKSKTFSLRLNYEASSEPYKTVMKIYLACDDHSENPTKGWGRSTPRKVFMEGEASYEMGAVRDFYKNYCSKFYCHELHSQDDNTYLYRFFDAYESRNDEEEKMSSRSSLWEVSHLKHLELNRFMKSNRGTIFYFVIPLFVH